MTIRTLAIPLFTLATMFPEIAPAEQKPMVDVRPAIYSANDSGAVLTPVVVRRRRRVYYQPRRNHSKRRSVLRIGGGSAAGAAIGALAGGGKGAAIGAIAGGGAGALYDQHERHNGH